MDNSDKKYVKLSQLVNDCFTIKEARGYNWKRWNNEAKRMEVSERYEKGFSKKYSVITDKGLLELGSGQLSSLLEAVYSKGSANINGKTFNVKSNGKTGMDIRYFFNLVKEQLYEPIEEMDSPIDFDEVPFD